MTGIGTVLADDPSLNVRLSDSGESCSRQPMRVVLDSGLRMPPAARMLTLPGKTLVFTASDDPVRRAVLEEAGAEVLAVPTGDAGLDLQTMLNQLGEMETNEVLLEAGATLSGAMLQAGLVDELIIYMAPHIMGGEARGLFSLPGVMRMDQRLDVEISDIRAVGNDWRIIAKPLMKH
jgi:diaminohydroxyphosphoribosylaminopyrimidine deaminase/5-amino-6-(5-phosphoribosylamino)uracil reductase